MGGGRPEIFTFLRTNRRSSSDSEFSSSHFATLFLSLELFTLPVYGMMLMSPAHTEQSESSIKYFILSMLSTGILLYGISWVYGMSGSLEFSAIFKVMQAQLSASHLLFAGILLIMSGALFKLGVCPFQQWIPEIYMGTNTPVTLYIATQNKIAAFAIIYKLLIEVVGFTVPISKIFQILGVVSLVYGNICALAEIDLKRLLGYSSIANMGFVLLGFACYQGFPSVLYYLLNYLITIVGIFGVLLCFGSGEKGDGHIRIKFFRGFARAQPWHAFMLLMLLLSLGGVPPFIGFFAKVIIIQALLLQKSYLVAFLSLFASCIGLIAYLKIICYMYFKPVKEECLIKITDTITKNGLLGLNVLLVFLLSLSTSFILYSCYYLVRLTKI